MKVRRVTTCHTCRARKLACDGQTPACARCIRSGKICAGYEHDVIFRPPIVLPGQEQALVVSDKRRQSSSSPRRSSKKLRRLNPPQVGIFSKQEEPSAGQSTKIVGSNCPVGVVPTALSWPLLDIISLVVQNFSPIDFLQDARRDPSSLTPSAPRVCGGWVEALPILAREQEADDLLSPSIKTFAVSIISRGEHGIAPVSDALEAQSVALSSLRIGMQQPFPRSNLLAAASMCLFLAEMILPTSNTSAEIHAKGISDLLQLQPPATYSSGVSHQLFVGFRPVMFLNSFSYQQQPFLAQTPWLEAPFSRFGLSPLQRLFSDMAGLPGIITTARELVSTLPSQRNELAARDVILALEQSVRQLLSLEQSHGEGSQSNFSFTGGLHDHFTALHFSSITAANFFTHIWGFRVACARSIRRLMSHFPHLDTVLEETTSECLTSKQTTIDLAALIFRSIEFLTRDEFKLFGAASTIMPLRLAGEVLRDEGAGAESAVLWHWYHAILRMSETTGYSAIAKQILESCRV